MLCAASGSGSLPLVAHRGLQFDIMMLWTLLLYGAAL
jgi:hypothetical protein